MLKVLTQKKEEKCANEKEVLVLSESHDDVFIIRDHFGRVCKDNRADGECQKHEDDFERTYL